MALMITDLPYEAKVQVECCFHCFFCFLTGDREIETHEREVVTGERSMRVRTVFLYVNRFHEAKTKDVRRKGTAQLLFNCLLFA